MTACLLEKCFHSNQDDLPVFTPKGKLINLGHNKRGKFDVYFVLMKLVKQFLSQESFNCENTCNGIGGEQDL